MRFLNLDFETGSPCDLRKCGAAKYAEHPDTRIICVSFTTPWDDKYPDAIQNIYVPPHHHTLGLLPAELINWVLKGKPVAGWNLSFEYHIWNTWVSSSSFRLKPEQLYDTMAQAAYWGLPLSLDAASEALFDDLGVAKDKEGSRLMKSMARPRAHKPGEPLRWWDVEDPDKRKRLIEYCDQDVRTEKAIQDFLPPMPSRERKIWLMDFKANARGVQLDTHLSAQIKKLAEEETGRLSKELAQVTDGKVTGVTKAAALKSWVWASGVPGAAEGLAKDRLPDLIRAAETLGFPKVKRALEIRQEAAKSSIAKIDAMTNFACSDGRLRGLTQYYGAFRTGRWAGRGPQVQNFPRSVVKRQEDLIDFLRAPAADVAGLKMLFGVTPLEALSSALRGCLTVAEGKLFAAIDFSQIEARVLAWLCGNQKILNAYLAGEDLYVLAAAGIYGVHVDRVTADQRQVGKVSILALGYQGGVGAFQTMAANYGLVIPDAQADEIKTAWRGDNPEVVNYWYAIDKAAKDAIQNPGQKFEVVRGQGVRISFAMWRGNLLCQLPSQRTLCYRGAKIVDGKFGPVASYMGVDQYTRKWVRIESYGGKFVENICQAVARDVMADAMVRINYDGCADILGSVHDEALLEIDGLPQVNKATQLMKTVPAWATGLPLDADGYVGSRFKKG